MSNLPPTIIIYIELNISFLIGLKCTVNFLNQLLWHHQAADYYIIIMSRTLKVMGTHVMYYHGAWFLRVIMSILCALCCLLSVKKINHDFHFFVQCIIDYIRFLWHPEELSKGYQMKPTPKLTLIILTGYHKKLIQWLYI